MDFLWFFEFCGKTSVLTMSSQDEIKEVQRKVLLWSVYGGWSATIWKMAALMFSVG